MSADHHDLFRERWEGASFCVLFKHGEKRGIDENTHTWHSPEQHSNSLHSSTTIIVESIPLNQYRESKDFRV